MKKTKSRVRVRGQVQGVGFRYTTQKLANRYAVNGWVRNEPDGSVQIEAEGTPEEVKAFLDSIRSSRVGAGIDHWEQTDSPAGNEHRGFHIASS